MALKAKSNQGGIETMAQATLRRLLWMAKSNQGGIETNARRGLLDARCDRQNRTKVGLKPCARMGGCRRRARQNRTKVGLKRARGSLLRRGRYRAKSNQGGIETPRALGQPCGTFGGKIEPRWD